MLSPNLALANITQKMTSKQTKRLEFVISAKKISFILSEKSQYKIYNSPV